MGEGTTSPGATVGVGGQCTWVGAGQLHGFNQTHSTFKDAWMKLLEYNVPVMQPEMSLWTPLQMWEP